MRGRGGGCEWNLRRVLERIARGAGGGIGLGLSDISIRKRSHRGLPLSSVILSGISFRSHGWQLLQAFPCVLFYGTIYSLVCFVVWLLGLVGLGLLLDIVS